MTNISNNVHIATTWSALTGCVLALWWAFGFAAQVENNTKGLRSAEIRDVSQELRYLNAEKQKMLLFEQENGITVLSTQIKDGYAVDIGKLERKRKCLKEDKASHLCDED